MTRRVTWTSMTGRPQRGSIGAEKTIRIKEGHTDAPRADPSKAGSGRSGPATGLGNDAIVLRAGRQLARRRASTPAQTLGGAVPAAKAPAESAAPRGPWNVYSKQFQ